MLNYLISWMIFIPILGAIVQSLFASRSQWVALGASLASSAVGVLLLLTMRGSATGPLAIEAMPWVGSFAISYELGIDGLSALFVLLIMVISPVLLAAEWNREVGARGIRGLFLVLQGALIGAVTAQDLFLLFFFWTLASLPLYFLIGIWGGKERESAAFRYIVTAALGNAMIFTAFVLVYYAVEPHTFSIRELIGGRVGQSTIVFFGREVTVSSVAFGLICAGLALRAPVWPLHGWFTKSAIEAAPSVFVAIAGLILPISIYILVRLTYSLFPDVMAMAAPGLVGVGLLNVVVGVLCAVSQKNLKSIIAFFSMASLGLLLVGVGSLSDSGAVGSVYGALTLGLGVTGLGLALGLLSERSGEEQFLTDSGERVFGGIALRAPAIALVAAVSTSSLLGFPGLGGFISQGLLLIGSYKVSPWVVLLSAFAIVTGAHTLFSLFRWIFLGQESHAAKKVFDLTLRERGYLFPVVLMLVATGVYPKPWLELVRPAVLTLLSLVK